jgi:hypothetical protein
VGRRKEFLAQRLLSENVDLSIKSEGGREQVAAEKSFVLSPKMIAGTNCHHAARRGRDLLLPGTPTVRV